MSFISHIKESKAEMVNVKWPSRKQTVQYTIAIVVISILIAAYVGALDVVFSKVLAWIIG